MNDLPFHIDQVVESRSFLTGFRGAWFRCKIKDISKRKGQIRYALDYFDYPDQKILWTKVYQKPPHISSKSKVMKRQLMVRPRFPPVYHESQKPDVNSVSEMIVIIDDAWEVGDLVDWWTDGCYWSGRVAEMLGDEKVKIELPSPPVGEGSTYEAFTKDLRPCLHWSPENSWMVPMSTENRNGRSFARIIKPANCVTGTLLNIGSLGRDAKGIQSTDRTSDRCNASLSSQISVSSLESPGISLLTTKRSFSTVASDGLYLPETNMVFDVVETSTGKTSCSDSVSSSHVRDVSMEFVGTTATNVGYNDKDPSKKMKTGGSICLNSMCSNTIEATILDLEELVHRVKWIRGVLEYGMPLSSTVRASWEFLQHRASHMPK
ncbi:Agenet domain protein [Quillaja saponaria]|uniref:Agenet domain protein n=1 Tax=Quillaja saponaria TaxID=32244 RepID=A0AAD7LB33_QUISA|nr:Agenet domain protein [Quillaja saponaria]